MLGLLYATSGFTPSAKRRDVLSSLVASFAVPVAASAIDEVEPTQAQRSLKALNAGSRRLSDAGIEEGDLVSELLRRTEMNKDRNAAIVKASTEANAYQAIDGSVGKRLVTDLNGLNRYLDANEIRELTLQRRLACAPDVMQACRMVEPSRDDLQPLQLPEIKKLQCDSDGRRCKFQ